MALIQVIDSMSYIWPFFLITWHNILIFIIQAQKIIILLSFILNVIFFTTLKRPVKGKEECVGIVGQKTKDQGSYLNSET